MIVFVVDKSCLLSMYTILSAKLAGTLYNIKCVAVRKVTHINVVSGEKVLGVKFVQAFELAFAAQLL